MGVALQYIFLLGALHPGVFGGAPTQDSPQESSQDAPDEKDAYCSGDCVSMLQVGWRRRFGVMSATGLIDQMVEDSEGARPLETFADGIPRLVHVTWKNWTSLDDPLLENLNRWIELNPTFRVMFWEDADVAEFLKKYTPEDHRFMVRAMRHSVPLFDYFRYLLMYTIGGVYADVDVKPLVPVEDWAPPSAKIIAGWEIRVPDNITVLSRPSLVRADQIQQWTMAAAPGHAVLNTTLWNIFNNFPNNTVMENTMLFTGAAPWTDAVINHCGPVPRPGPDLLGYGEGPANDFVHSDIVVLRKERFAYKSHFDYFSHVGEKAARFVSHEFRNSWVNASTMDTWVDDMLEEEEEHEAATGPDWLGWTR